MRRVVYYTFMVVSSALLAERENYKDRCEALMIENQCISGLAFEAKVLGEKSTDCEKAVVASKTTPKRQKKIRLAANKRVTTLRTKLANAKVLHSPLVEITTRSEADASQARSHLQDSQARFIKFEQEAKLAGGDFAKKREQSDGSAEEAEKALRQLTQMSNRAQALENEVKSLKLEMDGAVKTRDDAISSAKEKDWKTKMLESCIGLWKDGLYLLKRKESTGCDVEVVSRKVANAKGKDNNLVDETRQDTFNLYAHNRHSVDQTLLALGTRLRKLFYREVQELQRSVHAGLCDAAGGFQESFVSAPEVVNRNQNLIVGQARQDESARLRPCTTHSANCE